MNHEPPQLGIIMGSKSDWPVMEEAARVLDELSVPYEARIVSAHRTPDEMARYAEDAAGRGLKAIICGAGGAAHLPGMVAAYTILPVIGVPVLSRNSVQGIDSLLSIVQMPAGVPVATVAINGAQNAGILAAQILGTHDYALQQRLKRLKASLKEKVEQQNQDFTSSS